MKKNKKKNRRKAPGTTECLVLGLLFCLIGYAIEDTIIWRICPDVFRMRRVDFILDTIALIISVCGGCLGVHALNRLEDTLDDDAAQEEESLPDGSRKEDS